MSEVKTIYNLALRNRRNGIPSELDSNSAFLDVKPEFYADGRILSEDALKVFNGFKDIYPPYGLIDAQGRPFTRIDSGRNALLALTYALKATAHAAFDLAVPSIASCPYHEVIAKKLGGTAIPLRPIDNNAYGLDELRNVVTPGAELNTVLFVSLLNRLPSIQQLHGNNADPEEFARRSVGLLREPLAHPQQWAKAFVYTLGTLPELLSSRFLNDDLALAITKVEGTQSGNDRLGWAMPTADFTLRMETDVVSRVLGSERDFEGPHIARYPIGTRLDDIKIDEPTIGCPGNLFATAMWERTVDVMVGENLWDL